MSEKVGSWVLVGAGRWHSAMGRVCNWCLGGAVSVTAAAGAAAEGHRVRLTMAGPPPA